MADEEYGEEVPELAEGNSQEYVEDAPELAEGNSQEYVEEVVENVDWQVDDDGTQFFVDADGVRWELAEDGFAYAVDEPAVDQPAIDEVPAGDAPAVSDDAPTEVIDIVITDPSVEDTSEIEPVTWPAASAGTGDDLLTLDAVGAGYGRLPVLHGVSFSVGRGETAVILGLNGAGKTTTAMNVCGALTPWRGSITFDGQNATRWSTRQAVGNGIVMVPEGRRVFAELSVERNLQVGAWSQRHEHDWFDTQREVVFEYFPRLRERRNQLAGTLSGGEQQMLALGRGLMANPRLLIIDEASMGLAPVIVHDVFEIVGQINDDGVTVLMIEQNVSALEVADVGLVMEQGRIIRELRGDDLSNRELVSSILMG